MVVGEGGSLSEPYSVEEGGRSVERRGVVERRGAWRWVWFVDGDAAWFSLSTPYSIPVRVCVCGLSWGERKADVASFSRGERGETTEVSSGNRTELRGRGHLLHVSTLITHYHPPPRP